MTELSLQQTLVTFEKKLINEGKDLTLDKTVDIARTNELSQSQIKSMEGKRCLKCKKANHFGNMSKIRDQQVHKVSENPYQISDSFFC